MIWRIEREGLEWEGEEVCGEDEREGLIVGEW